MKNIILIGYRCSGKTSIARSLAERLGLPCYDSDVCIEEKCGKTIAEIFAVNGEPFFRDCEENVISEILDKPPIILASGGGAILRESTRKKMRGSGTVFWLKAKAQTLFERMALDPTTKNRRPNLTDLPPLEEIERLLKFREPLYRETAHFEIDTEGKTLGELTDLILVPL